MVHPWPPQNVPWPPLWPPVGLRWEVRWPPVGCPGLSARVARSFKDCFNCHNCFLKPLFSKLGNMASQMPTWSLTVNISHELIIREVGFQENTVSVFKFRKMKKMSCFELSFYYLATHYWTNQLGRAVFTRMSFSLAENLRINYVWARWIFLFPYMKWWCKLKSAKVPVLLIFQYISFYKNSLSEFYYGRDKYSCSVLTII